MKTLDEIAIGHETDRASIFTRTYGKPHDYARHYDRLFSAIRFDPLKIIEIGVGGGEGVKMWLEYFQCAKVFGVDIVEKTNDWNTPGTFFRYTFNQVDQSDDTMWRCWLATHGGDLDFVCDDGSHISKDIFTTFGHLWPALKPGGFYAIEDIGVSYGSGSIFVPGGFQTHMEWIKDKLDNINMKPDIDSMYFSKELCVLRKA